jgi:hypothetical protein
VNREIEALERVEAREIERVRDGTLAERSKNNTLRRVQRLRKQMDNLEERQRIYNRNISLQISLVGRIQSLDAMEMRGVDEAAIDQILSGYEEELSSYREVLETEEVLNVDTGTVLDDSQDLAAIEAEILGLAAPLPQQSAQAAAATPQSPRVREPSRTSEVRVAEPARVEAVAGTPADREQAL